MSSRRLFMIILPSNTFWIMVVASMGLEGVRIAVGGYGSSIAVAVVFVAAFAVQGARRRER